MNVVIYYPVLGGGGCEKRLAELGRWLLENGDEVWIAAAYLTTDIAPSIMCGQCGFPWHRIRFMEPGGSIEDHVVNVCREVEADILDVQWVEPLPAEFPCRAVYTTHGITQPLPLRDDFSGHISVETVGPHSEHQAYAPVFGEIWNWVDLDRFRFEGRLGKGVAFFGRSFKLHPNVVALAESGTQVDAFGFLAGGMDGLSENINWRGFADMAHEVYRYRIVLASAQAALEAVAAGRLVICGHEQGGYTPEASLVMPDMMPSLSARQLWYSYAAAEDADVRVAALLSRFEAAQQQDFTRERRQMRAYIEQHHDMRQQCAKVRQVYEEVLAL